MSENNHICSEYVVIPGLTYSLYILLIEFICVLGSSTSSNKRGELGEEKRDKLRAGAENLFRVL